MARLIAYASDVMPGDTLTSGYVEWVEESDDSICIGVSAYHGSLITRSIVLPHDALVERIV